MESAHLEETSHEHHPQAQSSWRAAASADISYSTFAHSVDGGDAVLACSWVEEENPFLDAMRATERQEYAALSALLAGGLRTNKETMTKGYNLLQRHGATKVVVPDGCVAPPGVNIGWTAAAFNIDFEWSSYRATTFGAGFQQEPQWTSGACLELAGLLAQQAGTKMDNARWLAIAWALHDKYPGRGGREGLPVRCMASVRSKGRSIIAQGREALPSATGVVATSIVASPPDAQDWWGVAQQDAAIARSAAKSKRDMCWNTKVIELLLVPHDAIWSDMLIEERQVAVQLGFDENGVAWTAAKTQAERMELVREARMKASTQALEAEVEKLLFQYDCTRGWGGWGGLKALGDSTSSDSTDNSSFSAYLAAFHAFCREHARVPLVSQHAGVAGPSARHECELGTWANVQRDRRKYKDMDDAEAWGLEQVPLWSWEDREKHPFGGFGFRSGMGAWQPAEGAEGASDEEGDAEARREWEKNVIRIHDTADDRAHAGAQQVRSYVQLFDRLPEVCARACAFARRRLLIAACLSPLGACRGRQCLWFGFAPQLTCIVSFPSVSPLPPRCASARASARACAQAPTQESLILEFQRDELRSLLKANKVSYARNPKTTKLASDLMQLIRERKLVRPAPPPAPT